MKKIPGAGQKRTGSATLGTVLPSFFLRTGGGLDSSLPGNWTHPACAPSPPASSPAWPAGPGRAGTGYDRRSGVPSPPLRPLK